MKQYLYLTHARYEFTNILRHPEQLLLILGTPLVLIFILKNQEHQLEFTLGACALASSFTSNAINTAFGRRYGSFKYLSVTPLGMNGLVIGQSLVGIYLLIIQIPVTFLTTYAISGTISIDFSVLVMLPLLVLFFTQSAFLFASLLDAEKVLAFSNLVFITLITSGIFSRSSDYSWMHPISGLTALENNFGPYAVTICLLNASVGVMLSRFFRWID